MPEETGCPYRTERHDFRAMKAPGALGRQLGRPAARRAKEIDEAPAPKARSAG
jgi:hypothetical protein